MATRLGLSTLVEQQDRVGGYSTTMSPNYYDAQTKLNTKIFNPYSVDEESISSPDAFGEHVYEIEKEYNNIGDTKVEEQNVQKSLFMPSLKKEQQIVAETEAEEYVEPKTAIVAKINTRGKIMIAVYAVIVAILSIFAVYNGIIIAQNATSLATKYAAVSVMNNEVDNLEKKYNSLGTEEVVREKLSSEYRQATENDIVEIDLSDGNVRSNHVETPDNWFNNVCEFFSNMFN